MTPYAKLTHDITIADLGLAIRVASAAVSSARERAEYYDIRGKARDTYAESFDENSNYDDREAAVTRADEDYYYAQRYWEDFAHAQGELRKAQQDLRDFLTTPAP